VHVVREYLNEFYHPVGVQTLDGEFRREDIRQFGTVAIPSAGGLLLVIVEVTTGQQVSEDQCGDVTIVFGVQDHGYAPAVVQYRDGTGRGVDVDF